MNGVRKRGDRYVTDNTIQMIEEDDLNWKSMAFRDRQRFSEQQQDGTDNTYHQRNEARLLSVKESKVMVSCDDLRAAGYP